MALLCRVQSNDPEGKPLLAYILRLHRTRNRVLNGLEMGTWFRDNRPSPIR